MTTQVEVVYPSTTAFSGSSQLNLGPYLVPDVTTLLRCEVRGQLNYQGQTISASSVTANFPLWAVQWVPHSAAPQDCITTADGPNWLIREQIGKDDVFEGWAPSTDAAASLLTYALRAEWAGQLAIGASIDLYMSMRAPTGVSLANANLYASIRFWWA